ncbi:organic cation transporter-like protein isoform X6 [Ylistrum balloti]|uniref:organic cation transporter-like protein isoform X6 n=1 Tax=Ylistrum balloti TaxID=509963 RepID=UPI002905D940|nr:organic cation transporter-like protein isoform X6 [Ylistrum balloti]
MNLTAPHRCFVLPGLVSDATGAIMKLRRRLRCAIPGYPNDTYAIQSSSHKALVNRHVPTSMDGTFKYVQCNLYDRSYDGDDNSTDLKACSSWVYDKSVFINTFTSEHDIVCEDKFKTSHAQMIFFGGVLLGAIGFGSLSDMLIPESPRWLISQGKIDEANNIIKKAAKVNKVTIPENILTADSIDEAEAGRLWHLFTSRVLLIRTLIIFFNWGVVSMVYYGLSLNTGNLGGDFYVNFLLSGLVEFPAYTLCLLLLDRVGRRLLHASCMIVGGVACIITLFPMIFADQSLQPITVTLAMLGKVGVSAAFAVIYVWSAELYPTVVRNAGMGASSSCARVGGMIAPYIADLNKVIDGDLGRAVPLVVFGTMSVVAGILSLWLPETNKKDLPETLGDSKRFGQKELSEKCGPRLSFDNKGFDSEQGITNRITEDYTDIKL